MATNVDRLIKIKDQIAAAENALRDAEAEQKQVLKTLKAEFGVSTMEEAEEQTGELSRHAAKLEGEIAKGLEKLEEMMQ